jgi:integrase
VILKGTVAVLTYWRGLFTDAQPEQYVFPHEKYGLAGNDRQPCAWEIEPTQPMHRWKVARESVRKAASVSCRFHDMRHTFISRLAQNPSVSEQTIKALAGHVSRQMLERYSNIRSQAKQAAIRALEQPSIEPIFGATGHKIGHGPEHGHHQKG